MYIHLYIKVSFIVIHDCSISAIQDTLKPWCLGSYADLAYSSYSDASTHIVITKRTEAELATVSGCMHAYTYQTSFMHNVSSSYFGAASLTVALLAASSLHLLARLWFRGVVTLCPVTQVTMQKSASTGAVVSFQTPLPATFSWWEFGGKLYNSSVFCDCCLLTLSACAEGCSNQNVCLSVCHSQDLGEGTIVTLQTSINAKQIMFYSSLFLCKPVHSFRKSSFTVLMFETGINVKQAIAL